MQVECTWILQHAVNVERVTETAQKTTLRVNFIGIIKANIKWNL